MPETTTRQEAIDRYVELDAFSTLVASVYLPAADVDPLLAFPVSIDDEDLYIGGVSELGEELWKETGTPNDPLDFKLASARGIARTAAIFAALAEDPEWLRAQARYFATLADEHLAELSREAA